jgi:hypothetical protein
MDIRFYRAAGPHIAVTTNERNQCVLIVQNAVVRHGDDGQHTIYVHPAHIPKVIAALTAAHAYIEKAQEEGTDNE